jgi:HK97 family phage prohead protease
MNERKSLTFSVKAVGNAGEFSVYAAVFNNIDRSKEIIEPGAFKNLPDFVSDGWGTVNHEWEDLPVAMVDSAVQDAKGLLITGRFHSTGDAQDVRTVVRERMDAGKPVKCSIGYKVTDDEMRDVEGQRVRVLKGIELYEFSFVNMPANPMAEVVGVKSWADDYEKAVVALKEGRILSRSNRERLAKLKERMAQACADLEELLTETDATMPEDTSGVGSITDTPGKSAADSIRRALVKTVALRALTRCS